MLLLLFFYTETHTHTQVKSFISFIFMSFESEKIAVDCPLKPLLPQSRLVSMVLMAWRQNVYQAIIVIIVGNIG